MRGIEEGSEIEQKVATFFDDDTVSERVKDVFSSVAIYLLFHSFNATEGRHGLSFGYLLSKFSKVVRFAPYKRTLGSVQFIIIIKMRSPPSYYLNGETLFKEDFRLDGHPLAHQRTRNGSQDFSKY